ncbi:AraC family transcriptional regulator [Aestuariivita sp.]|jgi:AraC-like DNA-binding protein|uniref:AraC family transcriptional regulator n=1 Tax=Aestuariivita sp. TaxID=1872407 RepID=UPI00216E7D7F|nr:AraC family transcriptional regulator [Aestuariivita sp.]MCE8006847.1 AraC family transcriptional regulator [Aestuariivita sp.]
MTAQSIAKACALIERDLSAPHPIARLARDVGMAEHHFQRQFAAATGETVAGYVRARRLERAAIALRQSQARVLDIALDCGFSTHAAMTRAFKAHFGVAPAVFRRTQPEIQSQDVITRPYLRPVEAGGFAMTCDCVEMPAQWLAWRKATGMTEGRSFPDLSATRAAFAALSRDLNGREAVFGAGYRTGPSSFEDPQATAHYGAFMEARIPLDWPEGWTRLPAGPFAIFPHFGPLTTVHLTWHRAARVGLGRLGLRFRAGWMFETYLSADIDAPRKALTALIHLPVEKSTFGTA